MRPTLPSLAAAFVLAAAAVPLSAQDYYSDIRPILTANCVRCHSDSGVGWSMEDPEEAFRKRRQIAGMILDRTMPPWLAEPGHQDYVGDMSLSPAVLDVVRSWRDAGMPKGEARPDAAPPARHAGFQADVSIELMPGGSYLPEQSDTDEYRCFVVDWTGDEVSWVTGFRAVPGNLRVAHHVVVHAVSPEMRDRFKELEDGEEGRGYRCFGGALPDRLDGRAEREAYEARYPSGVRELSRGNWWLAHWAPGMDGHRFPEGTGLRLEPGSALVVQMHYYTREAPGESDAGTRLDFQVASSVERPALHLAQTRNAWLVAERNGSMVIPPGERATYEVADDLGDLVGYIARITDVEEDRIQALEIHSANLHMHAFGHSGRITLTDRNGRQETLLNVPRWDLAWQRDFTFVEPKVFARDELEGTRLGVECTYQNDTEDTVYGGYGSFDEMCFNFSYIAVRTGEVATESGGAQRGGR